MRQPRPPRPLVALLLVMACSEDRSTGGTPSNFGPAAPVVPSGVQDASVDDERAPVDAPTADVQMDAPADAGSDQQDAAPDTSSGADQRELRPSVDVGADLPDAPADLQPDARVFPPGCHYDCFGYTACQNGVVTQFLHAPVPCESWTGSCPARQVGRCQRGCGAERLNDPFTCPLEICAENLPKQPGAPCTSDAECRPTRAGADLDGGVSQVHLRCDTDAKKCVAVPAPTVPDWLGPCDPKVLASLEKGAYGGAFDPSCSGGRCVVYVPHDQACIYQGCSRSCTADEECPEGAVCQEAPTACDIGSTHVGYCKPGPRNSIGVGLPCR